MVDVWGRIFSDYLAGHDEPHFVERDDGVERHGGSIERYFEEPHLEGERELLARLQAPVLDLGAGAGCHALYLQSLGIDVVAADSSSGALDVCRSRGCRDVRAMDLRRLDLEPASFGSIIIMGNTVGAHQTPETLPMFLSTLRRGVRPGGHFLCTAVDPLDTDEPIHLDYHRRNRERGRPPGLTRIRMKYRDLVDEWMDLWLLTPDELLEAAKTEGWALLEERTEGALHTRLFQAAAT